MHCSRKPCETHPRGEVAERLIEYKIKMSEQWLESKPIKKKVESDSESDNEDEPPTSGKNKYKK